MSENLALIADDAVDMMLEAVEHYDECWRQSNWAGAAAIARLMVKLTQALFTDADAGKRKYWTDEWLRRNFEACTIILSRTRSATEAR